MKKLIAKIGLFLMINLIINSILIGVTFAATDDKTTSSGNAEGSVEDQLELADPLEKMTECIDLTKPNTDGAKDSDSEYLITIIEEPLSLNTTGEPGKEYQTRICYRNTFVYWGGKDHKKKYTITKLVAGGKNPTGASTADTGCSSAAEELLGKTDFKPSFTCSPVQVTLSKGGTSQIEGFIKQIYTFAASLVGIIAVAVIIISGIQISLSGGDSEGLTQAKDRIIKSLTGIAVLFLSGLILYTINPTFFVK